MKKEKKEKLANFVKNVIATKLYLENEVVLDIKTNSITTSDNCVVGFPFSTFELAEALGIKNFPINNGAACYETNIRCIRTNVRYKLVSNQNGLHTTKIGY